MTTYSQCEFTTSDGLSLIADVAGPDDAPAVILLHGGGQTRHSWSGAMRRLVKGGYHVINYDARGHGDSDWSPAGNYTVERMADDLKAIIATTARPTALVGASMGGIASFYAIGSTDAEIAKALVMVDIALQPVRAGVDKIHTFMNAHKDGFANVAEAANAVTAYNPDRPRPSDTNGLLKNLRLREDGRYYWHWDPQLLEVTPSAEPPRFSKVMLAVSHRVMLPTLLVRGGHSDIVDDDAVTHMQSLVPQTEVYEVPHAGHMVAGDRNDAFNEGVISFLSRHLPVRQSASD